MAKLSAEAKRRRERWQRPLLVVLVGVMAASGAQAYGRYQRLQEAKTRFAEGDQAWDRGDATRAEAEFEAALKAEPRFFPARDALSVMAWQRKNHPRCLALLREGIQQNPRDPSAYRALGETLFLMHDFRAAIPPLEAAERLQPTPSGSPSLLKTCRQALVDPPRFLRSGRGWTRPGPHATIHRSPCCGHDHEGRGTESHAGETDPHQD